MPGTNDTDKKQLRPVALSGSDIYDAYEYDDGKVAHLFADVLTELRNARLRLDEANDYVGGAAPQEGETARDDIARYAAEVGALWGELDAFLRRIEPDAARVATFYERLYAKHVREESAALRRGYRDEGREIRQAEREERAERGPKPSPTQTKLLQYLARSDPRWPTYLAAVRNRRDADPHHVSAPYGTVPFQTFDALRRRRWIEQVQESVSIRSGNGSGDDLLHADWRITNAGREAIGVPTVPTVPTEGAEGAEGEEAKPAQQG